MSVLFVGFGRGLVHVEVFFVAFGAHPVGNARSSVAFDFPHAELVDFFAPRADLGNGLEPHRALYLLCFVHIHTDSLFPKFSVPNNFLDTAIPEMFPSLAKLQYNCGFVNV